MTATAEGRAEIEAKLFDLRTAHDSLQQAKVQVDRDLAGLRQQLQGMQEALAAAEVCTHGSHPVPRGRQLTCGCSWNGLHGCVWVAAWLMEMLPGHAE